ncbi:MAG: NAD(P)-dependent oxidoreductase [Gemmataceae bacterium]|nr:NAD(P)-dependent oxidoreductase [Gemmata sp.]MDW8199240.1 NAD(P)-dependent oxidoreductase [Gemmataceae bacterium]
MRNPRIILITGAAGNMGRKLHQHWAGRYELRLVDRDPRGDAQILCADLSHWGDWVEQFRGVDVVVHLAANPVAHQGWPELLGPNVDALIHVYHAALEGGVKRVILASSNHVLGGYQDEVGIRLRPETIPKPGLRYCIDGKLQDSTPYATAKLFGERLGYCLAQSHGLETIAVRLGWMWRDGKNIPANLPRERGEWFRLMWLSDRDFLHLMDCCLSATISQKFLIVNGMSNNTGMMWDVDSTRQILGYQPLDDITQYTDPWPASSVGGRSV